MLGLSRPGINWSKIGTLITEDYHNFVGSLTGYVDYISGKELDKEDIEEMYAKVLNASKVNKASTGNRKMQNWQGTIKCPYYHWEFTTGEKLEYCTNKQGDFYIAFGDA